MMPVTLFLKVTYNYFNEKLINLNEDGIILVDDVPNQRRNIYSMQPISRQLRPRMMRMSSAPAGPAVARNDDPSMPVISDCYAYK